MSPDLPHPVARFRDLARREGPARIETLAIEAAATMRRPGMPRIPLEFEMAHRLGYEFVHLIRVGRHPLAVRFGLDAYVGGRGLTRIGRATDVGPAFDQGALIALWGEAISFPSAWENREDIRWEPVDDATALLVIPGPEGEIPISVGFDPTGGWPTTCEADRYRGNGPKVRWRGRSTDWRRLPGGVLAPMRLDVQWLDEPSPWLEMRTRRLRVNVPVDAMLEAGRRAVLAAGPDPGTPG